MVVCEKCGGDSAVSDSRPVGKTMRRRRYCKACGASWATIEVTRESLKAVVDAARAICPETRGRKGAHP
jgi:transcriptional regulator NrdR family protein